MRCERSLRVCTALGLAERGKRVVLVERGRIGWAASGRNGGFALPGYQIDGGELIDRLGPEKARHFYQLSLEGFHLLRSRIDKYSIPCDVKDAGELVVSCFKNSEKEYANYVSTSNEILGTKLELWSAEKIQSLYRTTFYHHGVFSPDAFTVNPLAMTAGLARAARAMGTSMFEGTNAIQIEETASSSSPASRRYRVSTSSSSGEGSVLADHVVLATNYDPENQKLSKRVTRGTVPIYTYIAVTKPLPEGSIPPSPIEMAPPDDGIEGELGKIVKKWYCTCDDRFALAYFRPLSGGRFLWGGIARAFPYNDPKQLEKIIRDDLHRVFPDLAKAEVEVMWGGLINLARHEMPLIGQEKDGLWYCTGFGGHGVVATTLGGELIASAIAGGDNRWKSFQNHFPIMYCGWPFNQFAAHLFATSYQVLDEFSLLKRHTHLFG